MHRLAQSLWRLVSVLYLNLACLLDHLLGVSPPLNIQGTTPTTMKSSRDSSESDRRPTTRFYITCEVCSNKHVLERDVTEPTKIYIVCHQCETSLAAEFTQEHLDMQRAKREQLQSYI